MSQKLDNLINPNNLDSVNSAVSFYVEGDRLYRTILSKQTKLFHVPISELYDEIVTSDDDSPLFSDETMRDYIEENLVDHDYSYSEDDFVDLGQATVYRVHKSYINLDDLAKFAFDAKTIIPFENRTPSLDFLFQDRIQPREVVYLSSNSICEFSKPAEELKGLLEDGGYEGKRLNDVFAWLSDSSSVIEKEAELPIGSVTFRCVDTKSRSGAEVVEESWFKGKALSEALISLLDLGAVAEVMNKPAAWGVTYDKDAELLYITVNGEKYNAKSYDVRITPEQFSVFLSGVASVHGSYPINFLFSEEGKADLEKIRASLPEPADCFDKMVADKLEEEMMTSQHWYIEELGLCLGGKYFIPTSELLGDSNVLHVCDVGGVNMLDGSYTYDAYTELVRDGERYSVRKGFEGYTETESDRDRDIRYPSVVTRVTIRDGIASTMLDGPNTQMTERKSPADCVKAAVFAAAIFEFREGLRQRYSL